MELNEFSVVPPGRPPGAKQARLTQVEVRELYRQLKGSSNPTDRLALSNLLLADEIKKFRINTNIGEQIIS